MVSIENYTDFKNISTNLVNQEKFYQNLTKYSGITKKFSTSPCCLKG